MVISLEEIWANIVLLFQTYPTIWIILGSLLITGVIHFLLTRIVKVVLWVLIFVLIYVLVIVGLSYFLT